MCTVYICRNPCGSGNGQQVSAAPMSKCRRKSKPHRQDLGLGFLRGIVRKSLKPYRQVGHATTYPSLYMKQIPKRACLGSLSRSHLVVGMCPEPCLGSVDFYLNTLQKVRGVSTGMHPGTCAVSVRDCVQGRVWGSLWHVFRGVAGDRHVWGREMFMAGNITGDVGGDVSGDIS